MFGIATSSGFLFQHGFLVLQLSSDCTQKLLWQPQSCNHDPRSTFFSLFCGFWRKKQISYAKFRPETFDNPLKNDLKYGKCSCFYTVMSFYL